MLKEGVQDADAFQWQSQLKSAWEEDIDDLLREAAAAAGFSPFDA